MPRAQTWLAILLSVFVVCGCSTSETSVRAVSESYSLYLKGLIGDRLGETEDAIGFYRDLQAQDRGAEAAHLQLGFSYLQLNKYGKARREFAKAVKLVPDDEVARTVLALVCAQMGDYDESIRQYEDILKRNFADRDKNIQLRRVLSQLYFLTGDYDSVQIHTQELLAWDPWDEVGLYLSALIAQEQGRGADAIAHLEKLIEVVSDSAEVNNFLAYLYAEENQRLETALTLSQEAVDADPYNGAYLDTLGWIYFKMGDVQEAVEYLEKASRLMADEVIYNHLAQAYERAGRLQDAVGVWKESLRLEPDQKDVRQKLREIN